MSTPTNVRFCGVSTSVIKTPRERAMSNYASESSSTRPGLPFRAVSAIVSGISWLAPGFRPAVQNGLVRVGYNFLSSLGRDSDVLLNYGYASPSGDPRTIELSADDESKRYCTQLYHRVAGAVDLRGKAVLEVGSGRGGGAAFVRRYFEPATLTGLDFSPTAVAFCRQRHPLDGLTFVEGDAQDLPFPDASFDIVLNIESSHSYPNFERFLAGVSRVLRDGGFFLFADIRPTIHVPQLRDQIRAAGLTIVEEESITDGVVRALTLDSPARRARAEQTPRWIRSALARFSGVEGSPVFEAFRLGQLEYRRFVLQKPALSVR
jgi:SAM-dependent methyltransferase